MAGTNFTYTEFSAGTAIVAAHTNANNSAIDTAVTQVLNGTKSHSAFQATGIATLSGAATLSGVTTLSGATTISGLATFTAATTTFNGATPLTFEGATADAYETTLAVTDPTADRTITLPNAEGTVALTNGTIATATLAETVTVADAGSDATLFPLLATDGTGSEAVFADASALTYNASNGALSATTFVGALTGNVTGSVLTAAQTAITSVGTLSALVLSGTITGATEITASTFVRGGAGSVSAPSIRMGDSNSGFYGGNSEIKATVDGADELELTATSFLVPNVYNNTTASTADVQVHSNGSIRRSTSTRAIKKNILPLVDDGLLEGLTPVSFDSIVDDDQSFWGFIAEDTFDVDPHFTSYQTDKIDDRAILAKLVARVTALTARLEALETV